MNNITNEIKHAKQIFNLNKMIDNLVNEVSVTDFSVDTLSKAKLSLNLMVINTALKSIPRLQRLFEFSERLEDKIFDKNNIPNLNTLQQIELYKLAFERQSYSISFIDQVCRNIKWAELQNVLLTLSETSNNSSLIGHDSEDTARALLETMDQLKKDGYIKGNEDIINADPQPILDDDDDSTDDSGVTDSNISVVVDDE